MGKSPKKATRPKEVPRMTRAEFLRVFRREAKKGKWHLVGSAIRTKEAKHVCHCPLSFLADGDPCAIGFSAKRLGLSFADMLVIIDAADFSSWNEKNSKTSKEARDRYRVRLSLLKSVGL